MSWNDFHHREETLRAVMDTANQNRDGIIPMHVPGVRENFVDEVDLVGALQLKWHARLSGNIERALMREPMDLAAVVAAAWRTTAEQLPGVRMVLDHCTELPEAVEMQRAMTRAHDREASYLATAAGLASGHSAAAIAAGRSVEQRARTGLAAPQVRQPSVATETDTRSNDSRTSEADAPRESLADRIRAVLAA